ncbi:MAG: radical SAM protein [Paenibacillus polymyxa]
MPTEQCNFRCLYCYETFSRGEMSEETTLAVCRLITRRIEGGVRRLNIQWFGGEPLLSFGVINNIMSHAQKEIQSVNGFLSGTMTTNGSLLTLERMRSLLKLGVNKFQITLDGSKEDHDRTRISRNGGKTFSKIIENLINASSTSESFSITIRIHITNNNIDNIVPFARYLKNQFSEDTRFSFFVREVSELGGEKGLHGLSPEKNEARAKLNIINEILNPTKVSETAAQNVSEQKPLECCYASLPVSLVVRSNGELSKCTVQLENDNNRLGWLKSDGTIDIDAEKLSFWTRGLLTGSRNTLRCPAQQ